MNLEGRKVEPEGFEPSSRQGNNELSTCIVAYLSWRGLGDNAQNRTPKLLKIHFQPTTLYPASSVFMTLHFQNGQYNALRNVARDLPRKSSDNA